MLPRAELWARAAAAVEAGKRAALATVSRTRGSLPMAHDAKMLVTADGERFGTVGGGCTEADVTAQALATWETKSPRVVKHTLNADLAGDIGLSCGGTVEMFVEPLLPSDELAQLCRGVAQAIDSRVAGTVTTGLDWTPGPQKVATAGSKTWQVGSALNPRPSADSFVETIPRLPRLIVFGAGHVGAEIARAAARCDFHVVVVDDRADFANAERLPFAHEVIAEDFRAVLDRMTIDADGAPNAYNPDDTGLDALANAGAPAHWDGVITDRSGNPLIQQKSDPFPGYYISCTSLSDETKHFTDPTGYVDASKIPYVVLPQDIAERGGAKLGDFAVVMNLRNGKSSFAIYADIGTLGEGSVALADALGIWSDARQGGASDEILYLLFPGSGNRKPRMMSEIQSEGEKLVYRWGGMKELSSCLERRDPAVESGEF